jgi:dCTP deaminase
VAFWSDKTLLAKAGTIIRPFQEKRVRHCAYELSVGDEAYITSEGKKTKVTSDSPVSIPPGQFGLLITREEVFVPTDAIGFISIRAGTKFRGLVNVSGFHVDPGYEDRLMFSVYNAGSQDIVLDYDQPVFLIWFADLDGTVATPYPPRTGSPKSITADDIMKIQGEVASPAELKKQIENLKSEMKKKFYITEQSRLYNRNLLILLIGLLVSVVGAILGWVFIKPTFDRASQPKDQKVSVVTQQERPLPKIDNVSDKGQEKQQALPKTNISK